jgi:excisionase family DNA binding protein
VSGEEQSGTPVPMIEPLAVRIPEACRMIGIGRSKLYELIADGTIEIVKIGSVTVIPVSQLKALVELPAR